jgi:outer membrane protein assembly factor BamD
MRGTIRQEGWWLAVVLMALVGCATVEKSKPTYDQAVQRAFAQAEEAMEDGDYLDAAAQFQTIKSRFPYTKYAALADLRLADAYFEQEKFQLAVAQYRSFIKLHPSHEKKTYASFRIAESYFEQMPQDWFLLPPGHEKDLSKTKDALREIGLFIKRFPESTLVDRAKSMSTQVKRRLGDHEFYVATFYLGRGKPRAAAMRLKYLLEHYQGVGLDPNALFLLARSYLELGDTAKAKTALEDLVEYFPQHEFAEEARVYLSTNFSSTDSI